MRPEVGDLLAAEEYMSGSYGDEAVYRFEYRRLPRAVGADHTYDLAIVDLKADSPQDVLAGLIAIVDILNPADTVEQRCFSAPVGTDKTDDLACIDSDIDTVDGPESTERLYYPGCAKQSRLGRATGATK